VYNFYYKAITFIRWKVILQTIFRRKWIAGSIILHELEAFAQGRLGNAEKLGGNGLIAFGPFQSRLNQHAHGLVDGGKRFQSVEEIVRTAGFRTFGAARP